MQQMYAGYGVIRKRHRQANVRGLVWTALRMGLGDLLQCRRVWDVREPSVIVPCFSSLKATRGVVDDHSSAHITWLDDATAAEKLHQPSDLSSGDVAPDKSSER